MYHDYNKQYMCSSHSSFKVWVHSRGESGSQYGPYFVDSENVDSSPVMTLELKDSPYLDGSVGLGNG